MAGARAASQADALLLADESGSAATNVNVHPLVLLSILDHYNRRPDKQERVIGALLGRRLGSTIEVQNCFGVFHAESGNTVALGQDHHKSMYQQYQRINDKEKIVGWYATTIGGRALNSNSIYLHGFYAQSMDAPGDARRFIHLVVDTSVTSESVAVTAFVSSNVYVNGAPVANVFNQVKVNIVSSKPERVCLDTMIRGQHNPFNKSETLASIPASGNDLGKAVQLLLKMLDQVSSYVERVVNGEEDADPALGSKIADALTAVPRIRPELFDSILNSNVQDLLMVSYLSSLTKANLAISEKLSGVSSATHSN